MPDSDPKLRIVDDEAEKVGSGIVRLKPAGTSFEPVQLLRPENVEEEPARLESEPRPIFEGRSKQPGVEAILEKEVVAGNVEPWGPQAGGRFAGVPWGWFVLIVTAMVAASAWAGWQMLRGERDADGRLAEVRLMDENDDSEDRAARELVERIEHVVRDYLAADTLEKIVPLVRHPERVKPLIQEEWKVRPKRAMKFVRLTTFQPSTIPGNTFWLIRAEVRDAEPQSLIVEETGDSEVRVDWETHVCHQPMDWERYIADRPTEALDFRVWVTPDSHYSHEFSDTGVWRCYRLKVRNSEEHLFGYAAADGEIARELDKNQQESSNGVVTAILRLRVPAGSSSPGGVVIEKLVEPRWMYVTDPSKDGP